MTNHLIKYICVEDTFVKEAKCVLNNVSTILREDYLDKSVEL